jgi:hypothetical protein
MAIPAYLVENHVSNLPVCACARQLFTESCQLFTESRQLFTESLYQERFNKSLAKDAVAEYVEVRDNVL